MDSHTCVECEPSFVGSHVVDGARNPDKSIEDLRLRAIDARYGMILTEKYDSH